MLKPLLILPEYEKTVGASGQIQRVFWETIDRSFISPTILCEYGDIELRTNNTIKKVKSRKVFAYIPRFLRKLGFPDLCNLPDLNVYSWLPFSYRVGKRLISTGCFDYISSVSYPHSSHLIAYLLKKKTKLPWIAQFYDPWCEHSSSKYQTNFFRRLNDKMEKLVAKHADLIIHSNQKICNNWIQKYGDSVGAKLRVLPFSYNLLELPPLQSTVRGNKLRISHIGHIYGGRKTSDFVKAVAEIINVIPESKNRIEITFIGLVPEVEKSIISSFGINQLCTYIDTLPPESLRGFYEQSDIFLLLDIDIEESPFFPSKLMMYEYYRKPILAITTRGSVIETEMKSSKYPVFYYGDSPSIYNFLLNALMHYEELFTFDQDRWKQYQVREVQNKYKAIVEELLLHKQ